jgi:hypothetical protein
MPDSRPKNTKFERALLRLKARWDQLINAIFHANHDTGVYDKLAHDLTKSFNTFNTKYKFDSDQLSYAFRCLVLPVNGQIMDEDELGKRAYERQEMRKYFLLKILSYGIDETETVRPRQETPSLDGSIDVCSDNTRDSFSNGDYQRRSGHESDHQRTKHIKPTEVTIIVIDLLIEALFKFTTSITEEGASGRERIYHVMNITHVVDIIKRYLNGIRIQLEEENQSEQIQELNSGLLEESFERYKSTLSNALDLIDVSNPQTVFKSQLDLLHLQFTSLRSMIRR